MDDPEKTAPEETVATESVDGQEEAVITEDPVEKTNYMEEQKTPNEFRNIKSTNQQMPSGSYASKNSSGSFSKILFIALGLIVIGLIGVSGYLLRSKFTGKSPEPSPTPAVEITLNTPSPSPSFDRSGFSIRVLNGTKTSGLAASVSAKLTELGYQSDKTGNATNSAFARTIVRVKESATGLADQLIKDLAPNYEASAEGTLKDTDAADGEVIIGSK